MNRKEYEERRAEIQKMLADLKDQYIRENTDIEPGSIVMAAGEKCILKGYTVNSGLIYPTLVSFKNKSKKVYVSSFSKLTKI